MPKISASLFADEAAESIINGNMSYVIEQLDRLPKKQGLAAVALICDLLQSDDYQLTTFRRRLSDRI
jgi:hypothetical protein